MNQKAKFISFEEMSKSLTQGGIMAVSNYRYEAGNFEQVDYNVPITYQQKYANSSRSGTTTEPFIRLGADNKYPYFIMKAAKRSATWLSAFQGAVDACAGDGLGMETAEGNEAEGEILLKWLDDKKIDRKLLVALSSGVFMFGGAYPNHRIVQQADGKLILEGIDVIPYQNMRVGKLKEEDGESKYHWHSLKFNRQYSTKQGLKGFPIFKSVEQVKQNYLELEVVDVTEARAFYEGEKDALKGVGKFSYLVCSHNVFSDIYPAAPWESDAAIASMLIEYYLSTGDINLLENGMSADYIVSVPYAENKRDPKQDKINKKALDDKLKGIQGIENKGNMIVMHVDPRSNSEIKIAPIPHNNSAPMQETMEKRKDNILLTAWKVVDGQLIGIPPKISKGINGDQGGGLSTAEDIWFSSMIRPRGAEPIEEYLNDVVKPLCEEELGMTFDRKTRIVIKESRRFGKQPTDEIKKYAYSKDEIRSMDGYEPMSEETKSELEQGGSDGL